MLIASVDFPLPGCHQGIRAIFLAAALDGSEPVRPSRPTLSPAFKEKDTLWRTAGNSGAYWITKFSTVIRRLLGVFDGQYAGTLFESMTAGGS